jgi:IS30 family transposase
MSKNYNQLSFEQRYQIEALVKAGIKQKDIALQLKVHASTISRELKRNVALRGPTSLEYLARVAQKRTQKRHKEKHKKIKLDDKMKQRIMHYLVNEKWSPELISRCVKGVSISHEWIYQWIWTCKHTNTKHTRRYSKMFEYLRHGRRKRKRGNRKDNRGIILNRTSIECRPSIVAERNRLGDIEVDLMLGQNHKGVLLVMTDRASLSTSLRKLKSKDSKTIGKTIESVIRKTKYKVHTLTFDNDKAFADHHHIASRMNIKTYFTRPYTSQDKGTVENRIGVIRRFLPKKTNLTFVTDKTVKQIENKINNRPVRKFNYKTPNQVLLEKLHL